MRSLIHLVQLLYLQDSFSFPTWTRTSAYFTISGDLTIKSTKWTWALHSIRRLQYKSFRRVSFIDILLLYSKTLLFFFRWFLVWAIWCTIHQIFHSMRLHNDIDLLSASIHIHFSAHPRKKISHCLDIWRKYCIFVCILFLMCSIHNGYCQDL